MILTPMLGMWLSSSMAAYHNSSLWMTAGVGLLLFPILPFLWEQLYLWRRSRREVPRKQVLTGLDRFIIRTLALNIAFIGSIVFVAPSQAFRAASTRGDWIFDGYDGPISNTARDVLFTLAAALESRWHENDQIYGESDRAPEEPQQDAVPKKPDSQPSPKVETESDDTQQPESPAVATEHWPIKAAVHPALRAMPASAQETYTSVAEYLAERITDPYELTHALHDYIVLRLDYDYPTRDAIMAGNYSELPSQQPEDVFASHLAVCEGYSRLMRAMGEAAGLDVAYVVGNARILLRDSEGVGHAWNAVQIDGEWLLMDLTWDDAKPSPGSDASAPPKTTYLFTPPSLFGYGHFPDKPTWQLRQTPLSLGEFMRQPDLRPEFALYGLEMISPNRSQVSVSGSLHMQIANPQSTFVMATWQSNGNADEGQRCEVSKGDPIEITCALGGEGEYLVTIFANTEEYGSYGEVAKQLVNRR